MHEHIADLVPALWQLREDHDVDAALRLIGAIADLAADDADERTARALLDVGDTLAEQRSVAAFACLGTARAIFLDEGEPHGIGACDVVAAQLTAAIRDPERAVELYEHGLELVDVDADAQLVGRGWHNLGILLRKLGRHQASLEAQERALSAYRRTDLGTPTANCHVGVGIALHDLGHCEDALEPYAAARALYAEFDEQHLLADVDDRRGLALCDLGRYEEAAVAHEAAIARYTDLGLDWLAARSRRYRSHPLDHAERFEEALDELQAARVVFAEAGDDVDVALCDSATAAALIGLGQHVAARPLLDGARRSLEAHGLASEAQWCGTLLLNPDEVAHSHPE